jgi:hypothetical protein
MPTASLKRPLSPAAMARLAGVIYLIIVVGGAWAQLAVRDRVLVPGNAALTAANITQHELLYRLGFAVEVFYLLCAVPLKYLLYRLFGVGNRPLGITMILFAAIGGAVQATILLAHYAPLVLLGNATYLSVFTTAQRAAAAYLSLQLFDFGYMIALSFFGCFCIAIGYAILRCTFFPRLIGLLLVVEGALYLTNSFGHFVSPPFGARVFPFLLVSGIAELSFALTLLVRGVDAERWKAAEARAAQ